MESRESNTALGIEEPECVYVYEPTNVFGANSYLVYFNQL